MAIEGFADDPGQLREQTSRQLEARRRREELERTARAKGWTPREYDRQHAAGLTPDQRRRYELAYNPNVKRLRDEMAQDMPGWRDSFAETQFAQYSRHPEVTPEILAMNATLLAEDILGQNKGAAARRRYGDRLDPYYFNSDGSLDQEKLAQDEFVLQVEHAYYSNRTKVPLEWFLDYGEDLHLLGGDYADVATELAGLETSRTALVEAETQLEGQRQRSLQRAMDLNGWTEGYAAAQLGGFREVVDEVRIEVVEWSDEDKRQYLEDTRWKPLFGVLPHRPTSDESLDEAFRRRRTDKLLEARGSTMGLRDMETAFGERLTEPEENTVMIRDEILGGGLGQIVGWATSGIGWLGDVGLSWYWNNERQQLYQDNLDTLIGSRSVTNQREAEQKRLEESLGMPNEQVMTQMGVLPALEAWRILPQFNQDEHDLWVAMYGDEESAKLGFVDAYTNDANVQAELAEKARELRADQNYRLEQLEDQNFTLGDAVLDLLGVWGASTEYLATMGSVALHELFGPDESKEGWGNFFESVNQVETPSEVWGLQGTLVGLMIDLLGPAITDPTIVFFGPRLSASQGRMGVTSVDDAVRGAAHPVPQRVFRDARQVLTGHSQSGIQYSVMMDNLYTTGVDEMIDAALGGNTQPLRGSRPYINTPLAKVVDDIDYPIVSALINPDDLDRAAITAASEQLTKEGIMPVTIRMNPDSGAVALDNAERAVALQMKGYSSIPVTLQIDDTIGLNRQAQRLRALAEGRFDDALDMMDNVTAQTGAATDEALRPTAEVQRLVRGKTKALNDPTGRVVSVSDGTVDQHLRVTQDGTSYYLVDETGETVASLTGTPGAQGDISVWVAQGYRRKLGKMATDGRSTVDLLFDEALAAGDNYFEAVGSPGGGMISDAGLKNAQRQAQRYIDMGGLDTAPVEGTVLRDWAKGVTVDQTTNIDDALHVRPNKLLGDTIYGDVDWDNITRWYEQHLSMGGEPIGGSKTIMAAGVGDAVGAFFRDTPVGSIRHRIGNYMTPINANVRLDFRGTSARANINQVGTRLWSSVGNMDGWSGWVNRINDFYFRRGKLRQQSYTNKARAKSLLDQIDAIDQAVGGTLEDWAQVSGLEIDDAMRANHAQVRAQVNQLQKELAEVRKQAKGFSSQINDFGELHKLMDEMMDDFNRQHLATRKDLAKYVDPETGLVDIQSIPGIGADQDPMIRVRAVAERAKNEGISIREAAERELGFVPKEIADLLEVTDDATVNAFFEEAVQTLNTPGAWVAPASPLELMALANGGEKAARGTMRAILGDRVAQGLHTAHMVWTLDKVLTPRTAMVVSIDELVRMFHEGGYRAFGQYLEDRASHMSARVTRARKNPAMWDRLPKRWQDRLRALEEYPVFFRQLERSFLETGGVGFDVIEFKKGPLRQNAEYYAAARRTTGQLLNEEGFQVFFQGEDAFRTWFETAPEAQRLRDATLFDVLDDGTRKPGTWKEWYNGYQTVLDEWALANIKPGDRARARQIWQDAAERSAQKGSTRAGPVELPEWVLEGYGSVTGNKSVEGIGRRAADYASQTLFQGPVDYRRGFVSEWVRQVERKRLQRLYDSQGVTVLPDAEIHKIVRRKYPGLADDMLGPVDNQLARELFESEGVLSQSFVDELVESKVIAEAEHMLYSFHQSSRVGRASRAVFPFGKPWADMWAHWGRNVFSRPHLRGWISNRNFLNMGQIAEGVVDQIPFNPRSAAFISRLANTDFSLDRIEDDPIFGGIAQAIGLDKADLGGTMFLPVGGENPFAVLIPGLGAVPGLAALGLFNVTAPDALEDPQAFQRHAEEWGQFLPAVGYNTPRDIQGMLTQAAIGGGATTRTLQAMQGFNLALGGQLNVGPSAIGQDWKTRIAADRQVQLIFQDPDIWAELAELPPELADIGVASFLDEKLREANEEAAQVAGMEQFKEQSMEMMVPSRSTFHSQSDQLADAWLANAQAVIGGPLPAYLDTQSEDGRREAANWVRGQFFDLPDWERDALVAENEGMAVNLVSMWEWSDHAKSLAIPGSELPYRSGGSAEDLAEHELYINIGAIQPVSPKSLAERVIGTVAQAKANTARQIYVESANLVNEQRWEHLVPAELRDWFNEIAPVLAEDDVLPYRTGRELWEHFTELQAMYDEQYPDLITEDNPHAFSIPTKHRAWGEQMPSSFDDIPKRFVPDPDVPADEGWPLPSLTPKLTRLAEAAGVDLHEGIAMHDIYTAVANNISEAYIDNPVFAVVGSAYKAWSSPRSAGHQNATQILGSVLDYDLFEPETVREHRRTMIFLEEAMERRAMGDESWLRIRDAAADSWKRMAQDDAFGALDLDDLWMDAYGRQFGAVDWTPDEPTPLYNEEGELTQNAHPVMIRKVVDGDSLDVTWDRPGLGRSLETIRVRLLGSNQPELGTDEGEAARGALEDRIDAALDEGLPIYMVRDPERYGNTDMYGRVFGWIYIGDEPEYFPDTMIP